MGFGWSAGVVPQAVVEVAPVALSTLALGFSVFSLYFQRRDRRPLLEVRCRYEYQVGGSVVEGRSIHDHSQERLYLLLGDFLREYDLDYAQGTPVVRFALSNRGEREIYLDSLRLVMGGAQMLPRIFRRRRAVWVVDPVREKVTEEALAQESANLLRSGRVVELVPGDSAGYRFELVPLSRLLCEAGCEGEVLLALEAGDRLGNVYRQQFPINTDLWSLATRSDTEAG